MCGVCAVRNVCGVCAVRNVCGVCAVRNMCGVCAVRNVGPIYWENTSEAVSFKKLQVNVKPGAEPNGSL